MSFDVLQDKIRKLKNPTVAGLDARIEYVPEHIRRAAFEEFGVGRKGAAEGGFFLGLFLTIWLKFLSGNGTGGGFCFT